MSNTIERLRTAHHLVLRAQHLAEYDAAALVRTWPLVAAAVHQASRTIPETARPGNRAVERIALDAQSLGESIERQPWPGSGDHDPALLQVTYAFRKAATENDATLSKNDVVEANRVIASSLWTTAQLVGRAARDFAFEARLDRNSADRLGAGASRLAVDTFRRFNAVEQLAASSLMGRPSEAVTHVVDQLTQAVATWDIEAHRALLTNRSTAVLHVLAHQEAASVKALELFIDQAADSDIVDLVTAGRLRPILADSAGSWAQLRDVGAELSFGHTVVPMTLIDAATDLRETLQNATRPSDVEECGEILVALSGHLASAVTISAATRDLICDGELRAPARALARLSTRQTPDLIESPVDPIAIHRGLSVPLTKDVRSLLQDVASRVFRDADEAVNRASCLDACVQITRAVTAGMAPYQSQTRTTRSPAPTMAAAPRDRGMVI